VIWLVLLVFAIWGAAVLAPAGPINAIGGFIAGAIVGPFGVWWAYHERGRVLTICPACRSWVSPQATVCRHCGRDIPHAAS